MDSEPKKELTIDELTAFCKRKGFVFKSSDIYGGMSGFWDFGPLGSILYSNIKADFTRHFVHDKENMTLIDASIISHPKTWEASGHIANFADVAVFCKKCKRSTKIDKSEVGKVKCECGNEYEVLGTFSQMFKTTVGALKPEDAYLRAETAQGMFLDFLDVLDTSRQKLPFGIVQVGKCFRNEIAPRDFLFRSREFTIGEFEFFIHPEDDSCTLLDKEHLSLKFKFLDAQTQEAGKCDLRDITIEEILKEKRLGNWHAYWLAEQLMWFQSLGLLSRIKVREHMKRELSHYSSATFDMDYDYPFGSSEIAGNANRGQYDLTQHAKFSKQNMAIFDEATKERVVPRVIEPTFGIDRIFLALITQGYCFDEKRQNIVLKLPPRLAPVKAAVFPLLKDEQYQTLARNIYNDLKREFVVSYDASGSVGKRYARNDEQGTPMCITVDADSLTDGCATIRWRDDAEQVRVKIDCLRDVVRKVVIDGEDLFKLGAKVNTRVKDI